MNTNSLSNYWEDDWEDVNMTDADSIWNYCVNGLDHQLPEDNDPSMVHFANAVWAIAKDMNRFDKSKFPCAVCDQLGHTFEDCPVLKETDLNKAYLCLLLLVKRFIKGLNKLDPTGKKHHNSLNVLQHVTLKQLHALNILEDSPLHIVSFCVPTTEDCVDKVVNMLKDDFIPLLTHHHSAITNIASVMDSTTGSTNTGSTTDSLAHYAINKIHTTWKDKNFWMAGQGK